MDFPKITIVTPSFNQGAFLEQTIVSVLSQGYPNLEYIVVDGGSSDGSVEIIRRYASQLHFWCSEPDGGQYDAINKGFGHASGEIMGWLNSDDMQFPWALRTVGSMMGALPQVEWLTTLNLGRWDWHGFCGDVNQVRGYSRAAFLDGRYLCADSRAMTWIQQESTFWRRGLWERSGGALSTALRLASDFDLWARFYEHADLYGTPSPLAGFRAQYGQRSLQVTDYVLEAQGCLAGLRSRAGWKPSWAREASLGLKLQRFPRLGVMLERSALGYAGRRVVRRLGDSPQGYWAVEDYRFA
jgi:glycosyltransferase involved in cell wall biosynthesis